MVLTQKNGSTPLMTSRRTCEQRGTFCLEEDLVDALAGEDTECITFHFARHRQRWRMHAGGELCGALEDALDGPVFLIDLHETVPLPAGVVCHASVERRRGFCTPD